MAVTGDIKENYVQLQQSTGETFAAMADRIESPASLLMLDANGQAGARELAAWLRKQTDDQDALDRHKSPEAQRQQAGSDKPQGRSAQAPKSNG